VVLALSGLIAMADSNAPAADAKAEPAVPAELIPLKLGESIRLSIGSTPVKLNQQDVPLLSLYRIEFQLDKESRLKAKIATSKIWPGLYKLPRVIDYRAHAAVFDEKGQLLGTASMTRRVHPHLISSAPRGTINSPTAPFDSSMDFGVSLNYAKAKFFALVISERDLSVVHKPVPEEHGAAAATKGDDEPQVDEDGTVKPDDKNAVAALRRLKAKLEMDDQGRVIKVRRLSTDEGTALLKGLPRLKELYVECIFYVGQSGDGIYSSGGGPIHVTDAGLAHLKELPELESLHLRTFHITDVGLAQLEDLTGLKTLSVAGAPRMGMGRDVRSPKVTDAGLVHLKGLAKLEALHLQELKIGGSGLVHLKGLPELSRLSLLGSSISPGCAVGGQDPRVFQGILTSGCRVFTTNSVWT